MDVRKFRGAGVLLLCLLLTGAGVWNFRQGSLETAGRAGTWPVNEAETAEPKVGLVFQVTGSGEKTEEILKLLEETGKKATFFVTETWAETWPELVTEIGQEGHELGLLSQEGKRLDQQSEKEALAGLKQGKERLLGLTGTRITLFQERENRYGTGLFHAVRRAGCIPVGWSVDSGDWKEYGSAAIVKEVTENEKLRPGALILFHTGAENMAPALEEILSRLGAMGYETVPVGDCL